MQWEGLWGGAKLAEGPLAEGEAKRNCPPSVSLSLQPTPSPSHREPQPHGMPAPHSPCSKEASDAEGPLLSRSRPRGAQGEGLVESPLLRGAGEEEEEEAELEERQLSRSPVRGAPSEAAGLRGRDTQRRRPPNPASEEKKSGEQVEKARAPAGGHEAPDPAQSVSAPKRASCGAEGWGSQGLGLSSGRRAPRLPRNTMAPLGVLWPGGLRGVAGRELHRRESGEGPMARWGGESRPESSTFSGEEEEKGEGLEASR